jgi:hypothetical protein
MRDDHRFQLFLTDTNETKEDKCYRDYTHTGPGAKFPVSISDYSRTNIYQFDKEKKIIGVTYKGKLPDRKTILSVYIYPAGHGTEDRL